jgi:hypothetical protein
VIGRVWDGKNTYFRTKNGTGIRVTNPTDESNMTVEGSYQMYEGQPLKIARVYDQRKEVAGGNGKSYVLEGQPIMGTRLTVKDQLAAHPEFAKFLELMEGSGLFENIHNLGTGNESDNKACGGTNVSLFNTYHYTIYVPGNDAIAQLQRDGKLSSWEQVEAAHEAGDDAKAASDSLGIVNFLKYHIQDNALFIGAEEESGIFETAVIDPSTDRFYRVNATLKSDGIEVVDHAGNTRRVVTTDPSLFNLMAREYQYNSSDAKQAANIETSSSAVIHLIDKPLLIEN